MLQVSVLVSVCHGMCPIIAFQEWWQGVWISAWICKECVTVSIQLWKWSPYSSYKLERKAKGNLFSNSTTFCPWGQNGLGPFPLEGKLRAAHLHGQWQQHLKTLCCFQNKAQPFCLVPSLEGTVTAVVLYPLGSSASAGMTPFQSRQAVAPD